MKVMIVDDSLVIRRKIERSTLFQEKAVEVKQADNGQTAIDLFKSFQPDFITMDLTMPKIDGVECVKQIIALDPQAQILVISALTDKDTALQAIRNGARGFLPKPFDEEQIGSALSKLIDTP